MITKEDLDAFWSTNQECLEWEDVLRVREIEAASRSWNICLIYFFNPLLEWIDSSHVDARQGRFGSRQSG